MLIRVFKSAVDRGVALKRLSRNGLSGLIRHYISGQMLGMSEIFVPYRLYKIKIQDRGATAIRFLAVDSVSGTLDPIEFYGTALEFDCYKTRNTLPRKISEDGARAILLEKTRRIVFSGRLIRLSNPAFDVELVESDFYLSYWVGFYGDRRDMDLLVLNATTQLFEGAKMKSCVKEWLR